MIFVHIGPHKTGTSTLQGWLAANREPLRQLGYLYPGVGSTHNGLADRARRDLLDTPAWQQWVRDLEQAARAGACAHVIISAEGFSRLDEEQVLRMAAGLGPDRTKIVCYLRKPWERKASAHTQRVKSLMPSDIYTSLLAFDGDPATLDGERKGYPIVLPRWEQAFGLENLIVRVLEKEQLRDGDLVSDFAGAIGLPTPLEHPGYVAVTNVNEMPGLDQLRVMHSIDPRQYEGIDFAARSQLIAAPIASACATLSWNKSRPRLLSADLARRMEVAMLEQHADIARRYLGRANGALFAPVGDASYAADSLDITEVAKASLIELLGASLEAAAGGREALIERAAEHAADTDPHGLRAGPTSRFLVKTLAQSNLAACADPAARRLIAGVITTAATRLDLDAHISARRGAPLDRIANAELVALLVEALIAFHGGRQSLPQERIAARRSPARLSPTLATKLDQAIHWFWHNEPSPEHQELAEDLEAQLDRLIRVMRRQGFVQSPNARRRDRCGESESATYPPCR